MSVQGQEIDVAYSEYPIEKVEVKALHLDVSNYRFENDVPTEVSAMNYLWAEHDVADVARLILRDRYVDNEIPLVVEEDRKWIVLEGNRRVAALRALQDPAVAPVHQQEIERLLKRYAIEAESLPTRIRVMVFPNREAAAPVLARLHIGQPKLSWNLDEQAKFVLAQLRPSSTLDQLRSQLPAIKDIGRVVRMGRIRQRLRDTKYSNKDIAEYVAGPKLAMSSFEYAYKNADIQRIIGLSFDEESRIATWASSRSQILALERLLGGFKAGDLNTRRGLKPGSADFDRLLDEMRAGGTTPASGTSTGASPGAGTGGGSPAGGGTGSGSGTAAGGGTPGSGGGRGPNSPDTKSYLDLTGIDEAKLPLTLKHRVREVRRINVTDFPAAAAMLVRSLVEAAIKEHYGLGNGITATGTLGDVMAQVTTDQKGNGQLANAISNLNRTTKAASAVPGTGQWFNLVSHSVNVDVAGMQVQQAWRVVFPLVRFMLHEKRTATGKP